ncbi:MAG TPA: SDR family oxidoreductase, partial [Ilumatobacteraceae bacterium]|nr:SDR family oxidoreductase [Ilumatobacteraceae bacterium]
QGRIINTTSGAGLTGNFGQTNYATAKAAIVGLTQTLAIELKSIGVTANAIGPAGATRITATIPGRDEIINADDIPEGEYHPLNPANCSPLVAWLASDGSAMVTGQVLRNIYDTIYWMHGWREAASVSSGEKMWDATQLHGILSARLFGTGVDSLLFR